MATRPNMKLLRVVLAGFGRAGKIHFENLRMLPGVQITHILDVDVANAKEFVANYFPDTVDELVHDPREKSHISDWFEQNIDAVIVATPTTEHAEYVRAALSAGCAVFCEKPISHKRSEVNELYDMAAKHQRLLLCSFNRRFDPALLKVKAALDKQANERKDVLSVQMVARDSPMPSPEYLKISNGIFHDCMIHDIDIMLWLLDGRMPTKVTAVGFASDTSRHTSVDAKNGLTKNWQCNSLHLCRKLCPVLAEDSETDQATSSPQNSRHSACGYEQVCSVHTRRGVIYSGPHPADGFSVADGYGVTSSQIHHSFPQRYRQSYAQAMSYFMDCVRERTWNAQISKTDVLNACKLADAAELSCKTGQTVTMSQ